MVWTISAGAAAVAHVCVGSLMMSLALAVVVLGTIVAAFVALALLGVSHARLTCLRSAGSLSEHPARGHQRSR